MRAYFVAERVESIQIDSNCSAIARHEQYKLSPKTTRRTIYRVEHTWMY